jgi:hypothetical protein
MSNKRKGPPTEPVFPNLTPAPNAHITPVEPDDPMETEALDLSGAMPANAPSTRDAAHAPRSQVTISDEPLNEIRVTTAAYQYNGKLHAAPSWIDRNWLGNDGGPVLYVAETDYEQPLPEAGVLGAHAAEMIARVGDWVVREDATLPDGRQVQGRLKVVRAADAARLGLVEKAP